jgi:ABC-2 type transport system ATP-binding protein
MNQEVVVSVQALSKKLKDIQAVDSLDFTVYKKDIFGFLGPNGSGKSTTIRMMLTLIRPDSGSIDIFGLPVRTNRNKILSRMGALIEKPDFYEYLSARKNLEILSSLAGLAPGLVKIDEVLGLVNLSGRADSKVKTFSKGMKQRLGIAQSLLNNPEVLILDEPASGLDPSGIRDIRQLISYLNTEKDMTIILSSHHLQEIESVASRMLIIKDGRKVVEGEVKKLLFDHPFFARFRPDQPEKALALLKNSNLVTGKIENENGRLKIFCTRGQVSDINDFFVRQGIRIDEIQIEQGLEEYFLTLT